MELKVSRINYVYPNGGRQVLMDYSETFSSDEITALAGPNGCGKTTLTKIIMGLLKPDSGSIMLDGCDILRLSMAQRGRHIGYVMQHPEQQLFNVTVREEMEYGLRNLGLSEESMRQRTAEYLSLFDLNGYEERFPFSLSGGEQQRLVLAAVLSMEPEFLILDEPTTALDVYRRNILGAHLRRIRERLGCGILLVSHDKDFMNRYCDRVVEMKKAKGDGKCVSLL